MPSGSAKTIDFLRIGNPWLVGQHVNRVVPVFAAHNVIAPDFARSRSLQSIKDLAFDAGKAIKESLSSYLQVPAEEYQDLQETTFGLLAPERRIFHDHRNGGANEQGSLFPLVGGLAAPAASDDGLGKRLRELLLRHRSDWQKRLVALMAPKTAGDPATAFAVRLLGGAAGEPCPEELPRRPLVLRGIDKACAEFVDNLLDLEPSDNRVPAIRRFAIGAYFVGVLRMVAGVVTDAGDALPQVFVYCGLPPGEGGDPLVRAASKSFNRWIAASHSATARQIHATLKETPVLPRTPRTDRLRQQVRTLLGEKLGERQLDATMAGLARIIEGKELSEEWARRAIDSRTVGFSKSEYARRVRSLGANVGFAGPDRGRMPRLMIDTPLLGVLAQGIVGRGSLPYEDFVTQLSERFGLVTGIGSDDTIVDRLGDLGSEGYDPYEVLERNQELLRERMVRTGLARTYSDSHTEVFGHA
jgi:hypothetical protein